MKILIIHNGYPLNQHGGECVRTTNMAKSLNDMGHNVIVLLLYNFTHFKLGSRLLRRDGQIKFIQIPTLPISRFLKLGLFYNRLIVWLIAKIYKIDVIQAEITWSASTAGFVKKIPLVTDFHSDLVPELQETSRSVSFIEKSKQDNIYALTHSCKILCVSQTLHDNLLKTYNKIYPPNILPCSVDFDDFTEQRLQKRNSLKTKYGLDNKIILSYLGGTHPWQCLKETFDLFIKLQKLDSRYFFCLFTNGNLADYCEDISMIKDNFMTMPLHKENLVEHLSMIDAGFVIRDNLLLNLNSSPTKTGEYMAAGAMVIATKYAGDAPNLISESGFGFVLNSIRPDQHEIIELNNKIRTFVNNYAQSSHNIKSFIRKQRNWDFNNCKLQSIYKELQDQLKC